MSLRLEGQLIAPRARNWIQNARHPRIHSLFRSSVNLIEPNYGIQSIVLPVNGPGPFALVAGPAPPGFVIDGGFQSLDPMTSVDTEGHALRMGDLIVDASGAMDWDPVPNWLALGHLGLELISIVEGQLANDSPPGSFAALANPDRELPSDIPADLQGRALQRAQAPAQALVEAIVSQSQEQLVSAAEQLAGLGGGVTPSGDDYLIGTIHACWAHIPERIARPIVEAIVESALPRTNAISAAWLEAASDREAAEDWHLLAEAVEDAGMFEVILSRLLLRGHTSGADALAGFAAVSRALLNS